MCFSATASLVAGTALSGVGVATLFKIKRKAEIPFAMIPLLFGIQQISEGFVWLSFSYDSELLNIIMTYIYSVFSHTLWPIFVPFAIGLLETVPWRKNALYVCQTVGVIVGIYLLYFITRFHVTSGIINKSITYDSPHFYVSAILISYFIATIGSSFFSSNKVITIFGALTLLAAIMAYAFYYVTFISVWCFFGAIVSVMIFLYFFYFNRHHREQKPA